jgi:hypothetical protein
MLAGRMSTRHQLIHIHPEAPTKPALGASCNGCGVCCLAEPCPVGMIISRKRRGACDVLVWSGAEGRYCCGLMLPGAVGGWRGVVSAVWLRWVRRMIAAGSGCDASLELHTAVVTVSEAHAAQGNTSISK